MANSVSEEVIVDIPRAQAWDLMRDLSKAHYYVPGLQGCRIDTERKAGVGASRTVFPKNMAPLQETVIEWNEGYSFVIRLHRGDKAMAPFKQAEFVYAIEDVDDNRTRFKPAIRYVIGGGIFGVLLERLILRRAFARNVQAVATHLKQYYESGKPSNPDFKPN